MNTKNVIIIAITIVVIVAIVSYTNYYNKEQERRAAQKVISDQNEQINNTLQGLKSVLTGK